MNNKERTDVEMKVVALRDECASFAEEQTVLHGEAQVIQEQSRQIGAARNAKIAQRRTLEAKLRSDTPTLPDISDSDVAGALGGADAAAKPGGN